MRFLEEIVEKENAFLRMVREEEGKLPMYLLGAGLGGKQVSQLLRNECIHFDGFVVNRKYYEEQDGVWCLEDLLEQVEKINIVIAFNGFDKSLLAGYENKIQNVIDFDCWAGIQPKDGKNYFSYSWLLQHEPQLQSVYEILQDDLSRRCFVAFINQKISMKFGYLSEVKTSYQYFDEELVKFTDAEVFVDCGAYNGDTAKAFVSALERRGITSYREIISFEPDPDNYAKMKALNLKRHRCIPKGCSNEAGTLYFSQEGTSGKIEEFGNIKIEVDTIDHVVGDSDVTMIKMDIEGAELSALQGAGNVIKRCRPLLAISLYHKKEDLYEIPQYIMKLVPEYQFYIRAYEDTATELVLYAVCDREHGD